MERAGAGLKKIVAEALSKAPPEDAAVLAWPLVCGTAVAGKTRALALEAGVLQVQVPDAGWRSQLNGFAPHYLEALNRIVGGPEGQNRVERIEFVLAARKEAKRAGQV